MLKITLDRSEQELRRNLGLLDIQFRLLNSKLFALTVANKDGNNDENIEKIKKKMDEITRRWLEIERLLEGK